MRNCRECGAELTPSSTVDIKEFKDLCYDCYKKKPKHICVDFDGVLAIYDGWKGPEHLGEMREGADDFIKMLNYNLGYTVVIHTTRDPDAVWRWLVKNCLAHLVYGVTKEKVPALAYVDDRAICFRGNFDETLHVIRSFTPYWKKP